MTEQDIIQAYVKMRESSDLQSIPSEVLDFMKDVAIEKVKILGLKRKHEERTRYRTDEEKRQIWEDEFSDSVTWEEFEENYFWCTECGSYNDSPCICYAR